MKYNFLKGIFDKVVDLLKFIWHGIIRFLHWYKRTYKSLRWYGKAVMAAISFVAFCMLMLFLVDINFLWLFGKSPSLHTISHPKQDISSTLYSANGEIIGRYYRENRLPVTYEEISPVLIDRDTCYRPVIDYCGKHPDLPGHCLKLALYLRQGIVRLVHVVPERRIVESVAA